MMLCVFVVAGLIHGNPPPPPHITFDPYFVPTSTQPKNVRPAERGIVGDTIDS